MSSRRHHPFANLRTPFTAPASPQDEEELQQEQAEEAEGLGSEEEGAEAMEEDEGMPGTDLAVYGGLMPVKPIGRF